MQPGRPELGSGDRRINLPVYCTHLTLWDGTYEYYWTALRAKQRSRL